MSKSYPGASADCAGVLHGGTASSTSRQQADVYELHWMATMNRKDKIILVCAHSTVCWVRQHETLQHVCLKVFSILRAAMCLLTSTGRWPGLPFLQFFDLQLRDSTRQVVCGGSSRPLACMQNETADAMQCKLKGVEARAPQGTPLSQELCSETQQL